MHGKLPAEMYWLKSANMMPVGAALPGSHAWQKENPVSEKPQVPEGQLAPHEPEPTAE